MNKREQDVILTTTRKCEGCYDLAKRWIASNANWSYLDKSGAWCVTILYELRQYRNERVKQNHGQA